MKNIVIIGGNSGIGLAVSKKLNTENLFLLNRKGHAEVAAKVKIFDVTKDTLLESDLPDVIDGLVYCPGTINLKPFHRLLEKDYLEDFNVNVLGFIKTVNACLKGLKAAETPSVVAFSTIAAKLGMPFHASVAASKGAMEGLIRTLAAEMAPKIRFNAISISLTDTPLADKLLNTPEKRDAGAKRHPLNKIGQTDEIATTVAHVLSPDSAWMTGQTLHLDGGMSSVKIF